LGIIFIKFVICVPRRGGNAVPSGSRASHKTSKTEAKITFKTRFTVTPKRDSFIVMQASKVLTLFSPGRGEGKSVPLQAWRKLRFPDFMTTAQEGGKVVSLTHRPHLPPGNSPGTHFCQEAESTPGPWCDRKDYVNEKFQ
jgi:hypothetical protein